MVSTLGCFVAGGVGGFTCWLASYPQDIIKTKLQVSKKQQFTNFGTFVPDGGVINCGI